MNLYEFLQHHIGTLETVDQCRTMNLCITIREDELTHTEAAMLRQAVKIREDDVILMERFLQYLEIKKSHTNS